MKLITLYLNLHESPCLSVQSKLFGLTSVIVDYLWRIILWKPWHDNVEDHHLWTLAACHERESIHNFLRAGASHDHKAGSQWIVRRKNFGAHILQRLFIFNIAVHRILSAFSEQRKVWKMLRENFFTISFAVIVFTSDWRRFKHLLCVFNNGNEEISHLLVENISYWQAVCNFSPHWVLGFELLKCLQISSCCTGCFF